MDEFLDKFGDAKAFTTLYANFCFLKIEVVIEDQEKMSFTTRMGPYL